jgi:DNA polymerase (family 10)
VGDIEFVVLPKNLGEFLDFLKEAGGFSGGERKQVGRVGKDFPVEIYIAHDPKELGGLVFMYTGDFTFNIAMRMKAKKRGLKLNQYGIWQGAKPVLQSEDEVDFFEFLGVRYHEPEERSLARRVKPKKAVRAPKMGGDDDFERFWDDDEEE